MSALGTARLGVVAFTVVAVQALLLDAAGTGPFRHIDLPLALAVVIVVLRPDTALTTGVVFGLAVDLFHTRLFGIHCLAFSLLGSVAAMVPVGGLRTRTEAVAGLVAAQALTAITVVAAVGWITGGHPTPDIVGRAVQTTGWTLVIAVPVLLASGVNVGLATPDPPGSQTPPPRTVEWQ